MVVTVEKVREGFEPMKNELDEMKDVKLDVNFPE